MENKLLILLKNLKIESQANILKEGKISKVVVARDNSYTFHLVFNQILPFEEYQLLINNRDNFPYPTKYKISYETEFFNQNELLLYTGYLLEKLKKDYPVCATLTVESFKIEDKVIRVETCNEIQLEQLRQLRAQIEDMFNDVGIDKILIFILMKKTMYLKILKKRWKLMNQLKLTFL